jgi:excisionase family DNA binding protein
VVRGRAATTFPMAEPNDPLVAFQAAKVICIPYQAMYRLVRSSEIPAEPRGARRWVRRADLDAYLERIRVKPGELSRNTVPPPRKR